MLSLVGSLRPLKQSQDSHHGIRPKDFDQRLGKSTPRFYAGRFHTPVVACDFEAFCAAILDLLIWPNVQWTWYLLPLWLWTVLMEIMEITNTYCEGLLVCQFVEALTCCSWLDIVEWTRRIQGDDWRNDAAAKGRKTPRDGFCHDERNKSVTLRIFCIILLILRFDLVYLYTIQKCLQQKVSLKKKSIVCTPSLTTFVPLAISVLATALKRGTRLEDNLTLSVINILVFFSFAFEDLWVGEVEENHLAMWNWRFLRDWRLIKQR